eukprot:scaffold381_cov138-Cylindrotheca_fusiformis.AAC.13
MFKAIATIILLLLAAQMHAFVTGNSVQRMNILYSAGQSNHSSENLEEMKDLILSLSQEPTDHDRRTRLEGVFQEALARPNGGPKQFSDLFDAVLTKVGEEVQTEAKKKFLSQLEEVCDEATDATAAEETRDGEREKTPEELQLWALVDMMVQSKTIVKKANGELGSKGKFQ